MTSFSRTGSPQRVRLSDSEYAPYRIPAASAEPGSAFLITGFESLDDHLLNRVDALASLPENWDGDGGHAPSRDTIEAASILLVQVDEAARARGINVPEPKVQAAGDGSIGLVWRHPVAPWVLEIAVSEEGASYVGSMLGIVHEGLLGSPDEILALLPNQ